MKQPKYSDAQIMSILKQAEGGVRPVAELCREHGMSNANFYKWRSKFGGMRCTADYALPVLVPLFRTQASFNK